MAPASCARATASANGPASIHPGRPSRNPTSPSAARPVSPAPGTAVTSRAGTGSPTSARIAAANGCSLRDSSAAATASTSSRPRPSTGTTSTTVGRLRVNVPVLSNATVRTPPSASRAAPPLTSAPPRVAAPMAETTVTGTEIANAHGEAATSTTRARSIHTSGSPSAAPSTAMSTAATITPGTNGRAIRSANRCPAPLRACSTSTIRTTRASELSSVPALTATSRTPVPLTVPANTSEPGPTSTGMDSPVTAESSRALCPDTTTPSVATRSPGRINRVSPGTSSSGATSRSRPSRSTVARAGTRSNSARNPRRVRATE